MLSLKILTAYLPAQTVDLLTWIERRGAHFAWRINAETLTELESNLLSTKNQDTMFGELMHGRCLKPPILVGLVRFVPTNTVGTMPPPEVLRLRQS